MSHLHTAHDKLAEVKNTLQAWADDALLKQLHAEGGSYEETKQGNIRANYDILIDKLNVATKALTTHEHERSTNDPHV